MKFVMDLGTLLPGTPVSLRTSRPLAERMFYTTEGTTWSPDLTRLLSSDSLGDLLNTDFWALPRVSDLSGSGEAC